VLGYLRLKFWLMRRLRKRITEDQRQQCLALSKQREAEAWTRGDLDAVREEKNYQHWLKSEA
jgi:hypothetical protein